MCAVLQACSTKVVFAQHIIYFVTHISYRFQFICFSRFFVIESHKCQQFGSPYSRSIQLHSLYYFALDFSFYKTTKKTCISIQVKYFKSVLKFSSPPRCAFLLVYFTMSPMNFARNSKQLQQSCRHHFGNHRSQIFTNRSCHHCHLDIQDRIQCRIDSQIYLTALYRLERALNLFPFYIQANKKNSKIARSIFTTNITYLAMI